MTREREAKFEALLDEGERKFREEGRTLEGEIKKMLEEFRELDRRQIALGPETEENRAEHEKIDMLLELRYACWKK
jgi:hypothetical protein